MKFTQIGWTTLVIMAMLIVLMGGLSWMSASPKWPGAWVLTGVVLMVILSFGWLKVTVGPDEVRLVFGVGLIRRTWLLANIATVQPVRNPLWTGWGIRIGPSYTLYNVSGREAVELKFRDGSWPVRIGTDRPLAAAIAAHLSRA